VLKDRKALLTKVPNGDSDFTKMDELTARLEVLMRQYAEACVKGQGDRAQLEFRNELQSLIKQYGQPAVDAALDGEMSDGAWPSVSLH
jgi:hypothetical protein